MNAAAHNVTINDDCHIYEKPPLFWVEAIADIEGNHRPIAIGDCLLIDPVAQPSEGKLVLVGQNIEPFSGQAVDGVVTKLASCRI